MSGWAEPFVLEGRSAGSTSPPRGGDIRKAMNALELLSSAARRGGRKTADFLRRRQTAAQKSAMRYDREGDNHYDIASALMKSLRGSDPDAAVHYLAGCWRRGT